MLQVLTKPVVVVVSALLMATVAGPFSPIRAEAAPVTAMTLADPLRDPLQWLSSPLPGNLRTTDTGGIATNTAYPLTLEPPTGGRLETGRIDLTPGGAPGQPVVNYGPWRCSSIGTSSTGTLTSGYVNVLEVTYDDTGRLASLAADLSLDCPISVPTAQLRLASTVPYASLSAASSSVMRYTGETGTVPVTFTNDGPVTVHPGASIAARANSYHSDSAITDDGCVGTTLDPGQTCQVSISTAEERANVLLPVPELDALSARVGASPMMSTTVFTTERAKPAPVTAARSWPATDGIGLSWEPAGLGSYAVDRRTGVDGWQRIADQVGVSHYADTSAPANVASTYRITPIGIGDFPEGARETAPATPLVAWQPPTGAATHASVDGFGLLGATDMYLTRDSVAVWRQHYARPDISIAPDAQGWRTGTFPVSPGGDVRAGWAGPNDYGSQVTGTLTVSRAVLRADGTPAEFAAVLTGTRLSGTVTVPVRAIVVLGTVATGLPAYIVGDPGSIKAPIPVGSDQAISVALRNVGGAAGAVTTAQVIPPYTPPPVSAWSTSATCLNVQILPGGRCTTSVRVQYENASGVIGYPLAAATWRGAGGLATTVQLNGDWQSSYEQPTLTMTAPTLVRTAATVTLTKTDPQVDDVLQLHCRLDNAAFSLCTSPWSLTGLSNGKHTVTAYVTDQAGHMSQWHRATITADSVGPVTRLVSPTTLVYMDYQLFVGWAVSDPGSGAKDVQARRRTASPTTSYGGYVVPVTTSKSNGVWVTPTEGLEQCWSARAVDWFNQWGAWSAERCFLAPLDDRKLTARGFARESSYGYKYWRSTARTTGATLSLLNVRTRQVGLLVETCSTCGALDVYVGSTRLGRVYTYSATSRQKVKIWLPRQAVERRGTLVIRSVSSKRVAVDGVLIRHR